ncbi:hypothetical protein [Roseococcus pinisoli]|uniref:Uncharacterized protein n=1 Tax=Roseococcus pinisoli TaxID=2835040 RepID=A0ABS5QFB1_9PROT|nr:hypothetical protein [Roseococcus pinisoli]MBS7812384.1 hypothetical protein [Roseococcus pinisoli]
MVAKIHTQPKPAEQAFPGVTVLSEWKPPMQVIFEKQIAKNNGEPVMLRATMSNGSIRNYLVSQILDGQWAVVRKDGQTQERLLNLNLVANMHFDPVSKAAKAIAAFHGVDEGEDGDAGEDED